MVWGAPDHRRRYAGRRPDCVYDVYRTDSYVADDGWNDHDSGISCIGFFKAYQRGSYDRNRPQ